eukprot:UN17948
MWCAKFELEFIKQLPLVKRMNQKKLNENIRATWGLRKRLSYKWITKQPGFVKFMCDHLDEKVVLKFTKMQDFVAWKYVTYHTFMCYNLSTNDDFSFRNSYIYLNFGPWEGVK